MSEASASTGHDAGIGICARRSVRITSPASVRRGRAARSRTRILACLSRKGRSCLAPPAFGSNRWQGSASGNARRCRSNGNSSRRK